VRLEIVVVAAVLHCDVVPVGNSGRPTVRKRTILYGQLNRSQNEDYEVN